MAAEKAVSDRIAREMCRLLLLSHMSGLFQCHAEFREGLTQSGGFGGAGGGRSGGKGRGPVWRQWSGTPAPVHQVCRSKPCDILISLAVRGIDLSNDRWLTCPFFWVGVASHVCAAVDDEILCPR